ncbi:alpha/beta hydrolase [Flavobacterium zepuense]|uniref:Alpha/beta hydrolase n=1 Tax=Flavobacterium zepuense TaxID=2593302 RepID=A0A552V0D8_9FLAO|nr:alpha/beta hydrolase [Flavobacterium zepuense]TRW23934.1 alpha/beta hydrolase [Flavobacterium zepuense]
MNFTPLKYIYKSSGNPNAYTLLLLHGTGGDEADLIPLAENFGKSYNILSLRGNVDENGMPRFFKRLGMGIFDEDDLRFRTDEMVTFIKELAVKEGFNPDTIIALGYSNGANIAGAMLVQYPDFLAGAILYRPMQPYKVLPAQGTQKQVPVFFSAGKMDVTVSHSATDAYVANLEKLGFEVDYQKMPTGHNLIQQDVILSAEWLKKLVAV